MIFFKGNVIQGDLVNSDVLNTFVVLSEFRSYTKTAHRMNTSQSTISKRIESLENEVNAKLVIRDKKSTKLTAKGVEFLQYAKEILELEKKAISSLNGDHAFFDCIRIGCVTSLFLNRVSDYLIAFEKDNPDIAIHIFDGCSDEMLNLLYDNEIDVCFSYFPFCDNNYHCMELATDEVVLATGRRNPCFENGISSEELRDLPLIREEVTYLADPEWFEYIYSGKGSKNVRLETGGFSLQFLRKGIGYGFAQRRQAQEYLDSGELTAIDITDHNPLEIKSYMVYRNMDTGYKRRFVEFFDNI